MPDDNQAIVYAVNDFSSIARALKSLNDVEPEKEDKSLTQGDEVEYAYGAY